MFFAFTRSDVLLYIFARRGRPPETAFVWKMTASLPVELSSGPTVISLNGSSEPLTNRMEPSEGLLTSDGISGIEVTTVSPS